MMFQNARATLDDESQSQSTFTAGILTPSNVSETSDEPTFASAVPWPGNTYMIVEKASGRAVTLTDSGLLLRDISDTPTPMSRWLCVEKNNYFAFYNTQARVYMGHDGRNAMRATATALGEWEMVTPRWHPDGAYQLLVPYWQHTLLMITSVGNGRLARALHGETLWEFVNVH